MPDRIVTFVRGEMKPISDGEVTSLVSFQVKAGRVDVFRGPPGLEERQPGWKYDAPYGVEQKTLDEISNAAGDVLYGYGLARFSEVKVEHD